MGSCLKRVLNDKFASLTHTLCTPLHPTPCDLPSFMDYLHYYPLRVDYYLLVDYYLPAAAAPE
jgi:hypothetical protein